MLQLCSPVASKEGRKRGDRTVDSCRKLVARRQGRKEVWMRVKSGREEVGKNETVSRSERREICDESHISCLHLPRGTGCERASEFFRSFLQVPFLENTCDSSNSVLSSVTCPFNSSLEYFLQVTSNFAFSLFLSLLPPFASGSSRVIIFRVPLFERENVSHSLSSFLDQLVVRIFVSSKCLKDA